MKPNAFTLIELLIVVAIIAILAAIAVPNFVEAQVRSKVSRVKADVRSLATAIESYQIDNRKYPYCYPEALPAGTKAQHAFLKIQWQSLSAGNQWSQGYLLTTPISYIADIPWDPFMSKAWGTPPPPGWGWPSIPLYCSVLYCYGVNWDFVNDICGGLPDLPRLYPDAGYALYSCGPKLSLSWPPIVYDPTNGTVSRGLIIFLGKGAGFIPRTGFEPANFIFAD